jgi:lipopolysaccharide exporter
VSGVNSTLEVIGRPGLSARLQWNRLALLCLAVFPVAVLLQDLRAVAVARFVVTLAMTPVMFVVLSRALAIPLRDLWAGVWRPMLAAVLMGGIVHLLASRVELQPFARLALSVGIGAAAFFLWLFLLWAMAGRPSGVERELVAAARWRLIAVWRRCTAIAHLSAGAPPDGR